MNYGSIPSKIPLPSAESLESKVKESHLEWYTKQRGTTQKSIIGLPAQHKSQHSCNNTGMSRSICQNTVICNSTTTFSSEDVKIVTKSEISKPGYSRKILLEDPSVSPKNRFQDIQLTSGKSITDNSAATGKNEISQATTSSTRNKSSLSSVNYNTHNRDSTENKSTDTCAVAYNNLVPLTAESDMVARLRYEPPEVPAEIESTKNVALSITSSDIVKTPALPSGRKLSLSKSNSLRKKNADAGRVHSGADLDNKRQFGLSKLCAGGTDTSKNNRVITVSENSGSQCVLSCTLSHVEEKTIQSALDENISFKQPTICDCKCFEILQKKPWLEVTQRKEESRNSSSGLIRLKRKPAAGSNQEKPRSVTHVPDVTDTSPTLMTEEESVALASTMCNIVPSRKDAATVKGPAAECESLNSEGAVPLNSREESVKCNFSKSSAVPSVSTSGKQTVVLCNGSSLGRREATENEAWLQSGMEVECAVNKLHKYIALLCSDVNTKTSESCSHSSDKEIKTNLTSTVDNASVRGPSVMSEIRHGISPSASVTYKGRLSSTRDNSTCDSLLYSDFQSEDREVCSSPDVKRKKTSDCSPRNRTVSSSGSSVACIGSTSATDKESSKITYHMPGKDVMEAAATSSESETMHPQSENFKLSQEISRHPSKFSLTKHNSFELLMAGQKTPLKRSPSKKLSRSSPIKYMINSRSPHNRKYRHTSPSKPSISKQLTFDSHNTETKSDSVPLMEPRSHSSVPEFFFSREFVSYFEAIIAEVLKDRDMLPLISEEELKIVISFRNLETCVKKLYVRMLGRKYTWHRVSDIKYDDINVPGAFIELEESGFVTSGMYIFATPEVHFASHSGLTV
jgi:hypothetical protein